MTLDDPDKTAAITRALDAMWARFLPDIRARVDVLDQAVLAAALGPVSAERCEAARAAAHKLAGTLGTFGLQRGTELARALEVLFADGAIGPPNSVSLAETVHQIRTIIDGR